MDASAKMDGDVLRHAAIDQIHRLACFLQGLESGGGGRAGVRIISGDRIDVEVVGGCRGATTKCERQQEAEEEKELGAYFHEFGMLRRDLFVTELPLAPAAGNASGERCEGDASDQGAAFHDGLAAPVKAPMQVA